MSSNIPTHEAQGIGAISLDADVPAGQHMRLISVTCNFTGTPTTAENFTVTTDSHYGTAFDTLEYTTDPGTTSTSDIRWFPDEELILVGGDQVEVRYDGSDNLPFGVVVTFKRV